MYLTELKSAPTPTACHSRFRHFVAWAALLTISLSSKANPSVSDNFEVIAESRFEEAVNGTHGWTGIKVKSWDAPFGSAGVSRSSSNPISGQYLRIGETAGDGLSLWFSAPALFLGDQHRAFGGTLEFDLRQFATTETHLGFDLVLLSGTNRFGFFFGSIPDGTWRHYRAPLDESGAWINLLTRSRASASELAAALQQLDRLVIRGEYSTGNYEETHLDNVVMLARPGDPPQPDLSVQNLPGVLIRGEVGRRYRIDFREALQASDDWQTLAEFPLPRSPYVFVDDAWPGSSRRFYRAVLVP